MKTVKEWGGETVLGDISGMKITMEGIEYLQENSTIREIAELIPMAASIYELLQ